MYCRNCIIYIVKINDKISVGNSMISSDIWHKYHE